PDVADLLQVGRDVKCHVGSPREVRWVWGEDRLTGPRSPAVGSECAGGLGHLVDVLPALDSGAQAVGGVEDLVHETLGHRLLATLTRVVDEPAQGERGGAGGTDLDRDLVGRTTDAARAHLEGRTHVLERA